MGKIIYNSKISRATHKAKNFGHYKTRINVGKHAKVTVGTKGIHTSIKSGSTVYKPGSGRYFINTPHKKVRYYDKTKKASGGGFGIPGAILLPSSLLSMLCTLIPVVGMSALIVFMFHIHCELVYDTMKYIHNKIPVGNNIIIGLFKFCIMFVIFFGPPVLFTFAYIYCKPLLALLIILTYSKLQKKKANN